MGEPAIYTLQAVLTCDRIDGHSVFIAREPRTRHSQWECETASSAKVGVRRWTRPSLCFKRITMGALLGAAIDSASSLGGAQSTDPLRQKYA